MLDPPQPMECDVYLRVSVFKHREDASAVDAEPDVHLKPNKVVVVVVCRVRE